MGRDRLWSRRSVCWAIGCFVLIVGCSSMGNTLAQDLAWERWNRCSHFSGLYLDRIDSNGQIWVKYGDGFADIEPWRACLRQAESEQGQRRAAGAPGRVASVSGPPAGTIGPPGQARAPVWKRGDEWAYRWESPRGKGTFVWAVDREETVDGTEFYVVKAGATREIYFRKADLAIYLDKVGGAVETRRVPPSVLAPVPYRAGTKWDVRYTEEKPQDRQTNEIVWVCEAVSEETLTVPAGTFNAMKVVCQNTRTHSMALEIWYSWDVRQMIKERSYFAYGVRERELIAYRLK